MPDRDLTSRLMIIVGLLLIAYDLRHPGLDPLDGSLWHVGLLGAIVGTGWLIRLSVRR